MATPKTVSFHTLGCKLNFSETSALANQFRQRGYGVVDPAEGSDVFVLNTCSVTDFADRKCRKAIRQALRKNPDTRVVVTGCYAQLKPEEIAHLPGVDIVLGAAEKFRVVDFVESLETATDRAWVAAGPIEEVQEFKPAHSFGDRTRSFLKVQDGCDYKCSFCTIPQARGKSRSSPIQDVVASAKQLGRQGIREIVLTGVNIGDFGTTDAAGNKKGFIDLIRALDEVDTVDRFRISSIEPNLCSDEVIDFVSTAQRFMPHFHMPLQSGNDKQLRQMRRRYQRDLYRQRVDRIKTAIPHACIGADVIVGFPGETNADFEETFHFIHQLDVSYLHVFTYSERPNTPAADMIDVIRMEVRRERSARLRALSAKKQHAFYEGFAYQHRKVLLEADGSHGFTDNYIKVVLDSSSFTRNQLLPVQLGNFDGTLKAMTGTPCNQL